MNRVRVAVLPITRRAWLWHAAPASKAVDVAATAAASASNEPGAQVTAASAESDAPRKHSLGETIRAFGAVSRGETIEQRWALMGKVLSSLVSLSFCLFSLPFIKGSWAIFLMAFKSDNAALLSPSDSTEAAP